MGGGKQLTQWHFTAELQWGKASLLPHVLMENTQSTQWQAKEAGFNILITLFIEEILNLTFMLTFAPLMRSRRAKWSVCVHAGQAGMNCFNKTASKHIQHSSIRLLYVIEMILIYIKLMIDGEGIKCFTVKDFCNQLLKANSDVPPKSGDLLRHNPTWVFVLFF